MGVGEPLVPPHGPTVGSDHNLGDSGLVSRGHFAVSKNGKSHWFNGQTI